MLLLANITKLLAEIALMAMMGQWVLGLIAGAQRDRNLVYQLFQTLTRPVLAAVRRITPRVVLDRHIPLVAFLLLSFAWLIATFTRIDICVRIGVHLCQ